MTKLLNRKIYIWDFTDGYQVIGDDTGVGKRNPLQSLEFTGKINTGAVLIISNFDRFLDDVEIARKLQNLGTI